MRITKGLMETGNIIQETPQEFFDWMNRIFRFSLDVCALPENAKCTSFYSPKENGLKQDWKGGVWCNPPYGKEITLWVKKACEECEKPYNDFIVCLLPARTDTKWFHSYVKNKAAIFFIEGRLKFNNLKTAAPFPSMLAIYAKAKKAHNENR